MRGRGKCWRNVTCIPRVPKMLQMYGVIEGDQMIPGMPICHVAVWEYAGDSGEYSVSRNRIFPIIINSRGL